MEEVHFDLSSALTISFSLQDQQIWIYTTYRPQESYLLLSLFL